MQSSKKPQKKQQPKKQKKQPKLLVVNTTPAPVAKGVSGSIPNARFSASRGGKVCVRHSELLGTISSTSDAFNVVSFPVNPGLREFTGWLSNIARNYESYRFKNLRFRYVAACPTTVPGQVYVTADFDASDPAPLSEQQISYYQGTKYSAPWNHQEYVCTSSNLSKRKSYYVRSQPLGANQDIVLYDTANLYVATVGTGSNSLGKLWVEYEVELETPELVVTPAGQSLSGRLGNTDDWATNPVVTGNLPLTATASAGVLTLVSTAPYSGIASLSITGTGLTTVGTAALNGAASVIRSQATNAGQTAMSAIIALVFAAPGQTVTMDLGALTTVTGITVRMGQYNSALG